MGGVFGLCGVFPLFHLQYVKLMNNLAKVIDGVWRVKVIVDAVNNSRIIDPITPKYFNSRDVNE